VANRGRLPEWWNLSSYRKKDLGLIVPAEFLYRAAREMPLKMSPLRTL